VANCQVASTVPFLSAYLLPSVLVRTLTVTSACRGSRRRSFRPPGTRNPWRHRMIHDIDARRTEDHRLLQESLGLVAPVAPQLVAAFYDHLFAAYPQVRPMFPVDMQVQHDRLLKA